MVGDQAAPCLMVEVVVVVHPIIVSTSNSTCCCVLQTRSTLALSDAHTGNMPASVNTTTCKSYIDVMFPVKVVWYMLPIYGRYIGIGLLQAVCASHPTALHCHQQSDSRHSIWWATDTTNNTRPPGGSIEYSNMIICSVLRNV